MTDDVMPVERWLPVLDWAGFYEVSDQGWMRSVDRYVANGSRRMFLRGRIRPPQIDKRGYLYVRLVDASTGRGGNFFVHRLVLEAFVGPAPSSDMEGCHNNGEPADARLVNLRWDTRSENRKDIVRHGRHELANRTHCPYGHLLAQPNLVASAWRDGHRECLACARAATHIWRSGWLAGRKQEVGDRYYAALMRGDPDGRSRAARRARGVA